MRRGEWVIAATAARQTSFEFRTLNSDLWQNCHRKNVSDKTLPLTIDVG